MSLAGKICGICWVQKASECLVVCQSIGGEEWSLVVFHKCATITFNIAIKGYYLLSFDIQNDVHCVSFVRISYGVEPRNTVKTINLWMFMMYDKSFFSSCFRCRCRGTSFAFSIHFCVSASWTPRHAAFFGTEMAWGERERVRKKVSSQKNKIGNFSLLAFNFSSKKIEW